jgi:hypothetical protein
VNVRDQGDSDLIPSRELGAQTQSPEEQHVHSRVGSSALSRALSRGLHAALPRWETGGLWFDNVTRTSNAPGRWSPPGLWVPS